MPATVFMLQALFKDISAKKFLAATFPSIDGCKNNLFCHSRASKPSWLEPVSARRKTNLFFPFPFHNILAELTTGPQISTLRLYVYLQNDYSRGYKGRLGYARSSFTCCTLASLPSFERRTFVYRATTIIKQSISIS